MLKDLVIKNRSYRGYDESYKVSKEELKKIVDITRFTASSKNLQPLRYLLINEKEDVEFMQSITIWAKALPEVKLPRDGKCPTSFIVICQDTRVDERVQAYLRDVGIVAQTMLLQATEMGLGGCMIGSYNALELKKHFNLPEYIVPHLTVAIGKTDDKVVLCEANDSVKYYRDENDVHYVPKRKLEDIIL